MDASYGLAFCMIVTGFVFALSSYTKLKDIATYIKAVDNFQLLPRTLVPFSAYLLLFCEVVIVFLLVFWPTIAFILAIILLIVFSAALASVLIRGISTTCNCFGASNITISGAELVRNAGLCLCACVGLYFSLGMYDLGRLSSLEWIIIGFFGSVVAILWTQLSEIWRLLTTTLLSN